MVAFPYTIRGMLPCMNHLHMQMSLSSQNGLVNHHYVVSFETLDIRGTSYVLPSVYTFLHELPTVNSPHNSQLYNLDFSQARPDDSAEGTRLPTIASISR